VYPVFFTAFIDAGNSSAYPESGAGFYFFGRIETQPVFAVIVCPRTEFPMESRSET
jgi:hypothetical protein